MSDLVHAAGCAVPFEIEGETFYFSPLTFADYAVVHAEAKGQKMSRMLAALKQLTELPKELQEIGTQEAVRQMANGDPSPQEIAAYQSSAEGMYMLFSLMLRKRHPEYASIGLTRQKFCGVNVRIMTAVLNAVEGDDPPPAPEGDSKN